MSGRSARGIEAIERTAWPKGVATQLIAVRDLLAANEDAWTVETGAGRFSYARWATVRRRMEAQEGLALLAETDTADGRWWTTGWGGRLAAGLRRTA